MSPGTVACYLAMPAPAADTKEPSGGDPLALPEIPAAIDPAIAGGTMPLGGGRTGRTGSADKTPGK